MLKCGLTVRERHTLARLLEACDAQPGAWVLVTEVFERPDPQSKTTSTAYCYQLQIVDRLVGLGATTAAGLESELVDAEWWPGRSLQRQFRSNPAA